MTCDKCSKAKAHSPVPECLVLENDRLWFSESVPGGKVADYSQGWRCRDCRQFWMLTFLPDGDLFYAQPISG